ncbi:hypothetical protein [Nostoc sp. ChiVER01]|uniref:hypothetical protein n=1 Tax=Nostoc sp. ChiVER01 TaxID=3075382 RepID=UPI002AD33D1E|nr:hypothetical protein [Nostoc sp. ChiVER01]MDZ8224277.1 hypothetical protein [Nostoc sp. ChiVER01]
MPQQFYLVIMECNNTKSYVTRKERSPKLHGAIALFFPLCPLRLCGSLKKRSLRHWMRNI